MISFVRGILFSVLLATLSSCAASRDESPQTNAKPKPLEELQEISGDSFYEAFGVEWEKVEPDWKNPKDSRSSPQIPRMVSKFYLDEETGEAVGVRFIGFLGGYRVHFRSVEDHTVTRQFFFLAGREEEFATYEEMNRFAFPVLPTS